MSELASLLFQNSEISTGLKIDCITREAFPIDKNEHMSSIQTCVLINNAYSNKTHINNAYCNKT